jgi:hypothetical protein
MPYSVRTINDIKIQREFTQDYKINLKELEKNNNSDVRFHVGYYGRSQVGSSYKASSG